MSLIKLSQLIARANCPHPREWRTNHHLSDSLASDWCSRCGLKLHSRQHVKLNRASALAEAITGSLDKKAS